MRNPDPTSASATPDSSAADDAERALADLGPGPNRAETLISRIIDGESGVADWNEFTALASTDHACWQRLATAQREQALLAGAVGPILAAADRVELPTGGHAHHEPLRIQPLRRMGAWAGWAAAAALALTWTWTVVQPKHPAPSAAPVTAGLLPAANPDMFKLQTPDDALGAYLQLGAKSGTVMGELPSRVVVSSRPNPTGEGFEVTYLRQFVEKAIVEDAVRFGQDEAGRPVPVRVSPPAEHRTAQ
jgi:hypothetical protein